MSYQEKRTITNIVLGAAVLSAYCIHVFDRLKSGVVPVDDLKFWATTMLVFISFGIVAAIVTQIVFHILLSISIAFKEKMRDDKCDDKEIEKTIGAEMVEDEREKIIQLKSMRIGYTFIGVGFVAALVSLVLNYSPAVMINILFLSLSIGSLLEGFTQLYFYRKGVKNG